MKVVILTSKLSIYFYLSFIYMLGSLTLVIEDLLFKGLKSLNFFVKF